jgi:hypothetical protein
MAQRLLKITALMALVVGFTASNALAFSCPKLIGAGRTLAAKAMGKDKADAVKLLDEADKAHKDAVAMKKAAGHTDSMKKATDAVANLVKAMPKN